MFMPTLGQEGEKMLKKYEYVDLFPDIEQDLTDEEIMVYVGPAEEVEPVVKSMYRGRYAPMPMFTNRPKFNPYRMYGIEVHSNYCESRTWFEVVSGDNVLRMIVAGELKEV